MTFSLTRKPTIGDNQPKLGLTASTAIPCPPQETWCEANGIPDDKRSALGYGTKFKPEEPGSIADRYARAVQAYLEENSKLSAKDLHEILSYKACLGLKTYLIPKSGVPVGTGYFKKPKGETDGA